MTVSRETLEAALVALIRDSLIEGGRVDIPGLGTFAVRHIPSRVETDVDGKEVMIPPRDEVHFEGVSQVD